MSDKTVLVVGGDRASREVTGRELREAGYLVQETADGAGALACLEEAEYPPDLIAVDTSPTDMDGLELCWKLNSRSGEEASRIPILLIADERDEIEGSTFCEVMGICGVLKKPLRSGSVRYHVDSVLRSGVHFEGMRALIAEDTPVVSRIVRSALETLGVEVVEVSDGRSALELVARQGEHFDIVITDYKMPNMLGDEFCRRLKNFRKMENVPIFFISSTDDIEAVIGFFRAGASDYLKKPFALEEFRARVITHLKVRKYVLEMQVMNAKLHTLATTDGLTEVYNRRFFEENLRLLFHSARECRKDLCCLLLDLDRFKNINDRLGHAFGDYVLQQFGSILQRNCRPEDMVARYGGEEFIILMPGVDDRAAMEKAEVIREEVERTEYCLSGQTAKVTCSIGLSSLVVHSPPSGERLTIMADSALYVAKESGRNRVAVYDPAAD